PASCGLSWQTHSVQRCGLPALDRHPPALKLQCVLLKGHESGAQARIPARSPSKKAATFDRDSLYKFNLN
ncbi:hypothetical protein, partial [Pantoea brenneri]|uniref:hypothetical protein n=1 Tax=Pantoea brenneri TaxID=472694 RepID=UPI0028E4A684